MNRDVKTYLDDIIESIGKINTYTQTINDTEFFKNSEKQDAVIRRLEIIGEAVKKIPKELRDQYPDILWKEIAGMRDIIVHEYFEVFLEIVWRTIINDLPKIKIQIENIRKNFT
jgi:uncharacterized protein with HEPN domain